MDAGTGDCTMLDLPVFVVAEPVTRSLVSLLWNETGGPPRLLNFLEDGDCVAAGEDKGFEDGPLEGEERSVCSGIKGLIVSA